MRNSRQDSKMLTIFAFDISLEYPVWDTVMKLLEESSKMEKEDLYSKIDRLS